jgi:hypothetical protein
VKKMGKIKPRQPRRDDLGDLIGGAWRRSSPAGFEAAADGSRGRMRGESLRVSPCFLRVGGFEAEEGAERTRGFRVFPQLQSTRGAREGSCPGHDVHTRVVRVQSLTGRYGASAGPGRSGQCGVEEWDRRVRWTGWSDFAPRRIMIEW